MKVYIEDRRALQTLSEALNLAAKPESWVCRELTEILKSIKYIKKTDWSHVQSWDCGRQDALGDKHDQIFRRWNCLKIARRIQKGDGRDFIKLSQRVIGE